MRKSFFSLMLGGLLLVGSLTAVEQVKIKNIVDDPYRFRQDTVMVEGEVTQYGEEKTKHTRYYYLKGVWGGIIKVITNDRWPEVNERYEVGGIVVIDDEGEVTIVQQWRKKLSNQPPIPPRENKELMYYMIGAAVFLLLFVIVIVVIMLSGKKKAAYVTPMPSATGFNREVNVPEPENVIEGSTIKMSAPPPGTLKLLPGRFEVVSGDDTIKEIRFYKTKNQDETEITFGRGTGPNYFHIQMKPMTVSTRQAKLLLTNGKYTLINYSTTNPTTVNGTPLAKEGSVILEEGSKVEMGEVVFVFHEK